MYSFPQINISLLPIVLSLFHLAFPPKVSLKSPTPDRPILFLVTLEKKDSSQEEFELCLTLKVTGKQLSRQHALDFKASMNPQYKKESCKTRPQLIKKQFTFYT